MLQIKERIILLREAMKKAGVSACIIPGTDPHAGEYISEYWKERVMDFRIYGICRDGCCNA